MKYLLTFLFFCCALFASATDNYLVTTDGTTYQIDDPAEFESTNHSTSTTVGDYSFTSNSETVTVTRANVKSVTLEIPLTRAIKENETHFCAYLFYGCTNLTEANITFGNSDECTSVGNNFCHSMFSGCSSLVSLPNSFNLPQGITGSVGNHFCFYMFNSCSGLVSLPDSFNLPQGITSVGDSFCSYMFYNCSGLVSLPDDFNLPQGITCVGNSFCCRMFYGCSALVSLPDSFNLPQGITSVGNYFCYWMFYNCSSLVSLPDEFNLPQVITSVGSDFCAYMFYNCSGLVSLPDDFNLPQNIETTSQSYFCNSMFYNCSKLAEGETVALIFPFDATNAFYRTSFAQTTNTTTATANTTYKLKGNSDFYYSIRYYDQDGNLIKTQHIEKPEEDNSATIGEFAVTADDLTIEEGYAFRYWTYEDGRRANEEDVVSEDINLYAYISKIEKADGNSEYTYDLTDENFDYDDHECISINEDGDITITVGKDAYIIIEKTEGADLTLKDNDGKTLELETDDEGNLVYHYEGDDQAAFTITAEDGSVSKITIQNVADYYKVSYYYNDELLTIQYIEPVEDATIGEFAVTANDLNLKDNQTLTGWQDANGNEVTVNTVITEDIALYPMIYSPTSIFSTSNDAELISTEYYDLAGRKLAEPQRGVNIVVEYYSDGTQKSTKLLQK